MKALPYAMKLREDVLIKSIKPDEARTPPHNFLWRVLAMGENTYNP